MCYLFPILMLLPTFFCMNRLAGKRRLKRRVLNSTCFPYLNQFFIRRFPILRQLLPFTDSSYPVAVQNENRTQFAFRTAKSLPIA